jgi:hypothetical protein
MMTPAPAATRHTANATSPKAVGCITANPNAGRDLAGEIPDPGRALRRRGGSAMLVLRLEWRADEHRPLGSLSCRYCDFFDSRRM